MTRCIFKVMYSQFTGLEYTEFEMEIGRTPEADFEKGGATNAQNQLMKQVCEYNSCTPLPGIFPAGRSRCSSKCGQGTAAVQRVRCESESGANDYTSCKHHDLSLVDCYQPFPCPGGE